MNYGHFDDAAREYVITDPRTPVKWVNYLGTLAFGGLIDQTGGMLICKQDPGLNRITKYIPQMPDADFKGSTLYLRLNNATVITPFYVPMLTEYERYACHVGMGYTRIVSLMHGIETDATFFVPIDGECVLWDLKFTNHSKAAITLDAVPVVEYSHFDALKQFTNADWVPQTMQSHAIKDGDYTVMVQAAFMNRRRYSNYLTSNHAVASYESDRARFLGRYGTWAHPAAMQRAEFSNGEALRGDNIGALLHHLGELQPGHTIRLIVQLGQSNEPMMENTTFYRDTKQVDAAFKELITYWENYLGTIQVETPDAAMNSLLNIHHPRQCHTTKNWSRYLSLYQLGLGSRGIGFRDSSQDVLGVMSHMPEEARELIEKLLRVQKQDGSSMHQFYPLSMQGDIGDAAEGENGVQFYSDDHLWVILAVCSYVKETGNLDFLKCIIPYYDQGEASVLEHLQAGLRFTQGHVGANGLPLLGFADWNDTVNLGPGAESVFTAHLYGKALQEIMELYAYLGKSTAEYEADYATMKAIINDVVWDGEWYKRYFDAAGVPIGSHINETGKIYTNAQSWAVMSGFATPERAEIALNSVNHHLNTTRGIKLSTPGYTDFDPHVGGVSTYPPGAKENGGIFLHANPWVMIAETMLGHGARAYEYYSQISPAIRDSDEFECEPYVYPQNILGDEHPQFGLARNSWLSGTASWMYQAAVGYILGVRASYNGLLIDPCIPPEWDGFRMTRTYRGVTYHITVSNPQHISKGVASMQVDGQPVQTIPIIEGKQSVTVDVVMG